MAYGPQLARMLGAEYSVLGKSGEGVIHNWDEGWPGQGVHTENLLQTVRQLNPHPPIIAIEPVPACLPSEARSWTKAAVMECKALGDNNLFFIPLNEEKPLLEAQDYAGDNTHPLKSGSKKIALYLKDKVAEILGW